MKFVYYIYIHMYTVQLADWIFNFMLKKNGFEGNSFFYAYIYKSL